MKITPYFGFLALVCLSFVGFSQKSFVWKTGTSAGRSYRYVTNDPMKARFYTLKNGLQVILSENHKEPRIAALIPTRAGSNTDPRSNTGLAHYLEHMLFKGTDKYGSLDWAKEKPLLDEIDALYEKYNKTTDTTLRKSIYKEIDRVSGEAAKYAIANEYDKMMTEMGSQGTNAFTSFEMTVYTEDIPSNAVDRFLKVQAERFRNPVLRLFHTELEAVYEEKNRALDNDGRKVYDVRNQALFPNHNYGQQTTLGTIEHLKNPSLVEIRNYFKKYYVPNNMAIIMTGDFNPDVLITKIEKAFGSWKPQPIQEYKPAPEPPLTSIQTVEVTGPTPENLSIAWRWPGSASKRDHIVSTIVDELMNNSKAGLIDLNLVKAQKVLRAGCSPDRRKDYTVWNMFGAPKQGQTLDEVRDLLLGELAKLKKGDFDESIIKAIAANYKLNSIQGLDSYQNRAYSLLPTFINSKSADWNHEVAMVDQLGTVTKAEVMAFAKKYCGDNYVIINKRKGVDKSIIKVEKPTITPVAVNREAQTDFLKTVNTMPLTNMQPKWIDFEKDFKTSKIGNSEAFYVQNTDNDLFRLTYRFDMGSWHSKILPLALQYLQFVGTSDMNADQISTEFYKLASNYNANATTQNTSVSITGLNENFAKTVSLVEKLFTTCQKDEEAFKALIDNVIKQRNDTKANKGAILNALSTYAQFGPKNPLTGTQFSDAELKALKAQDMINFLNGIFQYSHQVIYYGPQTLAQITASLPALHKNPASFKANPAQLVDFSATVPTKPQVYFAEYDMVQAEINWIRPTTQFDQNLSPIVELHNNYFGGGMSSIVFQTIRESKALAYSTYAYYNTPQRPTDKYTMIGYVGTQADKIHESINSMNELMNDLPLAEQNLQTAKASIKKAIQTERILQEMPVYTYLSNKKMGIVGDSRKKTYEAMDKLTLADLKAFQDREFANKPFNLCIVGAESKIKLNELEKYGEVKKLSLEEIFGY